jgi:hypothetical protein
MNCSDFCELLSPRSGLSRAGIPGAIGSFFTQRAVPVANRAPPGGLFRGSALASPALVPRKPADLPSSRVSPLNTCPALRPRRPDSSTVPRSYRCCLPGAPNRRRPRVYKFRGSITRPASSLLLASHPASRRRTQDSLPTCGRALVGWDFHPLGDNDEFPIGVTSSLPNVSGFAWHTASWWACGGCFGRPSPEHRAEVLQRVAFSPQGGGSQDTPAFPFALG